MPQLVDGNSGKQVFGGRHGAWKLLVARLLESKSFLHKPFGRRCRKRPAHHRERSAARSRTLSKLLRNARRNARRRLTTPRRFRPHAWGILNTARRTRYPRTARRAFQRGRRTHGRAPPPTRPAPRREARPPL